MHKSEPTATCPSAIVEVGGVTKTFQQWQRGHTTKELLRNLFKPQKRTVTALDNTSFTVQRGEFVAYAGANGAGKSTTIRLLCGMLLPTDGTVSVLGLSPRRDRIALMKRLGVLFGNRSELWRDHPVAVSFDWKRVVWDIPRKRYETTLAQLIELLDLQPLMNTFVRELSLGQRMKADLALMLLHEPELILLDEPTIGLDVLAKRQMIAFLKQLNAEKGTTIIVTSHDMDDLEEMARRILLLSKGKLAFDGSFDELRTQTGGGNRLLLRTTGTAPALTTAHYLSGSDGVYEYEFNGAQTPIQAVLGELAQQKDITDVELRKAPIEQVITDLYLKWR